MKELANAANGAQAAETATRAAAVALVAEAVGSDGMILYEGNRVHCSMLFDEAQHGEAITLKLWRAGKAIELELPVYVNRADRISGNQHKEPPYLIVGGLVFTELSMKKIRQKSAHLHWREKG